MKLLFVALTIFFFVTSSFSQSLDELKVRARLKYESGDYLSVMELLDKAVKIAPKDGPSYFYRGLAKLYLGDNAGGCADLTIAKSYGLKTNDKNFYGLLCDSEYKLKVLKKFFYKHDKLIPSNGYRPAYTRKDTLRGSLRPERTCFDVNFYDLKLKLEPQKKFISGSNGISFTVKAPTRKIQIDLFSQYKISSILWNNQSLKFSREYDAIFVDFPEELPVNSFQSIIVNYSGKPQKAENPPWDGGFVWKKDKKGNRWDGVACEHLGASSWWPCKDHMSDEPDSMRMTFIAPSGYDVISNGKLIEEKPVDKDFSSHTWFVHNTLDPYNATFYMGKFEHFADSITNSDGTYPLDFYVLPWNLEKARETFKQNKEVLQVYEELFGNYAFPEDGFGMVESPFEGMEHQGAIAYGNDFDKKNNPYIHKEYDYIIVHEDAHEWWGNSISAADMADMWIQEGFATFAELLFMEKRFGYEDYLKEVNSKMYQIFNFWPLVENRDVNENTFASNDVYTKGAVLLNNLRCAINNDSLFFRIVKNFAVTYRKKIVTSDDFVRMVNEMTNKDFTPFFDKYLKETGLPVLQYSFERNDKNLVLTFKWTDVREGFEMPFCIHAGNKAFRLEATTKEQKVILNNADTFYFYNMWSGTEGVEKNAYTYYWTSWVK